MIVLDKTISLLFLIGFGSLPFLLFNWFRYMKGLRDNRKLGAASSQPTCFPYKSVLGFVAPIITIFLLSAIMTRNVKADVIQFLSDAKDGFVVKVENTIVADPQPVIEQLRQISSYAAHHTHPNRVIHIVIEAKGRTLALNLGRDSARENEYWVFYPGYRHTSMNEIGRITTQLFDSYK